VKDAIRRFLGELWRLPSEPEGNTWLDRLTHVPPPPGPRNAPRQILDRASPDGGAAAALAMTLTAYGHPTSVSEIDAEIPLQLQGRNALQLIQAAERRGLATASVSIDLSRSASALAPGDILHVDTQHFVVVAAVDTDGVRVLDPRRGGRIIAYRDGDPPVVALLFAASETNMQARRKRSGFKGVELPRATARRPRST
jgi:ABC-type bacteriocin/lantibiotic exporter with double-glycine peptidase domain